MRAAPLCLLLGAARASSTLNELRSSIRARDPGALRHLAGDVCDQVARAEQFAGKVETVVSPEAWRCAHNPRPATAQAPPPPVPQCTSVAPLCN